MNRVEILIDSIENNYFQPTETEMLLVAVIVLTAIGFSAKKDWDKTRRIVFPLLIFYICLVLGITVFSRLPHDNAKYNFDLFWSYRKAGNNDTLLGQIILNYLMLLPFGMLLPLYIKRRWVVVLGFAFSAMIELTQLFLRRGLFEFDDIVGNTLGVVIGVGIYSLIKKMRTEKGK